MKSTIPTPRDTLAQAYKAMRRALHDQNANEFCAALEALDVARDFAREDNWKVDALRRPARMAYRVAQAKARQEAGRE